MRLREKDVPMDPEAQRELEALDAALAGRAVDPDLEDLASLARELRAERPELRQELAAELDRRAEARFAGRKGPARLGREPRTGTPYRRRLVPVAAATATLVMVTGIAVTQTGVLDDAGPSDGGMPTAQPAAAPEGSPEGEAHLTPQARRGAAEAAGESVSEGAAAPAGEAVRLQRGAAAIGDPAGPGGRRVARTADLVLSAAPDEVRDVADAVVEVTHRYRGFVVTSSVSSGDQGAPAHGEFQLRIPTRNVQAALSDLSELAHVSSLTEGTKDITRRFVTAQDRIAHLRAEREELLGRLADAETVEEKRAIRVQLRNVRAALEATREDLQRAEQRVRFVPLRVSIRSDGEEAGGGGWNLSDALDDAVRVLEVSLGVALISVAVLVPLGLIGALAWGAARTYVRRQREHALDEEPRRAS